MVLPPVLQSTFSSWWLFWFILATCTRDTSSHIAAAPPPLAALQTSAPSGFGCQTTRSVKPACRRCCPPTLTCSSTREFRGPDEARGRRNDHNLWDGTVTVRKNKKLSAGSETNKREGKKKPSWTFWWFGLQLSVVDMQRFWSQQEALNLKDEEPVGFVLDILYHTNYFL